MMRHARPRTHVIMNRILNRKGASEGGRERTASPAGVPRLRISASGSYASAARAPKELRQPPIRRSPAGYQSIARGKGMWVPRRPSLLMDESSSDEG